MRTSFHHRPEAQHPNSSAIHKLAGRLPHPLARLRDRKSADRRPLLGFGKSRYAARLGGLSQATSWPPPPERPPATYWIP